jgi:hypothetical protein
MRIGPKGTIVIFGDEEGGLVRAGTAEHPSIVV